MAHGPNENKLRGRVISHRDDARRLSKRCYHPNCESTAIERSHFLQRNGVLDVIAEGGKVVELREKLTVSAPDFVFKEVGLASAFTFRGFCAEHDDRVFAPLEKSVPDYSSEECCNLLCYRALLNEMRKKEKNIDWKRRCLDDQLLSTKPDWRQQWKSHVRNEGLALEHMMDLKSRFEGAIGGKVAQPFGFYTREIPMVHVATSAFYCHAVPAGDAQRLDRACVWFNLLPQSGSTLLILATTSSNQGHLKLLAGKSETLGLRFISDVLIKRIETWCCRPSWYQESLKPREREIVDTILRLLPHEAKARPVPVNLFSERPCRARPD